MERLRKYSTAGRIGGLDLMSICDLFTESADRIEALEAENAITKKQRDDALATISSDSMFFAAFRDRIKALEAVLREARDMLSVVYGRAAEKACISITRALEATDDRA